MQDEQGATGEDAEVQVETESESAPGVEEQEQTDTVVDYSEYNDDYSDDYSDDYTDDSIVSDNVNFEDDEDYDFLEETVEEEAPVDEAPVEETLEEDYSFDEYGDEENVQVDNSFDLPLDEEGIDEEEEEQEEVDVNIDEGFLEDDQGNAVELPVVETRGAVQASPALGGNTFIFFFCALGGTNNQGAVNVVDLLNTGLGNAAQSLSIAPLPSQV